MTEEPRHKPRHHCVTDLERSGLQTQRSARGEVGRTRTVRWGTEAEVEVVQQGTHHQQHLQLQQLVVWAGA